MLYVPVLSIMYLDVAVSGSGGATSDVLLPITFRAEYSTDLRQTWLITYVAWLFVTFLAIINISIRTIPNHLLSEKIQNK